MITDKDTEAKNQEQKSKKSRSNNVSPSPPKTVAGTTSITFTTEEKLNDNENHQHDQIEDHISQSRQLLQIDKAATNNDSNWIADEGTEESAAHKQHTKGIVSPQPNDVLCGRGAGVNQHPGNVSYRLAIQSQKINYLQSIPMEKKRIIQSIVENVKGRFLKADPKTELWDCITLEQAKKKTGQALREDAPKIKRNFNHHIGSELNQTRPYKMNYLERIAEEGNEHPSRDHASFPPDPLLNYQPSVCSPPEHFIQPLHQPLFQATRPQNCDNTTGVAAILLQQMHDQQVNINTVSVPARNQQCTHHTTRIRQPNTESFSCPVNNDHTAPESKMSHGFTEGRPMKKQKKS